MDALTVLRQLDRHAPTNALEADHLARTHAFVSVHPGNFWRRTTAIGHITASAFVVNTEHSHALLLQHAALKRWLQLGGHVDGTDADPQFAALREACEEAGTDALTLVSAPD